MASRLGMGSVGLGREGIVIHCKWHLQNRKIGCSVVVLPAGLPLGVAPEGFMRVGEGLG